ncbi:MAG: mannosyl-3-phosphoglycerate phosphatase [Calditrichaceae bacterium]|nr:mannosyl-3-phosphoglycerate phosphatase [Calditrichia bacterium]NUQ43574.1 mannosyl-3-phosphoglycerate phosphatase [Calditrichaceae bacterium]
MKDGAASPRPVIFTDLDGTLLDAESYAFDESRETLERVKSAGIPVVFCSSKTRAEQEYYRAALGVTDPFIVENGSAIFIPRDYFGFDFPFHHTRDQYAVIELGVSAKDIRSVLREIREQQRLPLAGFGDLDLPELCRITGLAPEAARRALQREYSETIVPSLSAEEFRRLENRLAEKGLRGVAGSRLYTITGQNGDKGRAVQRLGELFRREFGDIITVGVGDSQNDFPMLNAVERPYLVQKPGRRWAPADLPRVRKIAGVGPAGWKIAMAEILAGYTLPNP